MFDNLSMNNLTSWLNYLQKAVSSRIEPYFNKNRKKESGVANFPNLDVDEATPFTPLLHHGWKVDYPKGRFFHCMPRLDVYPLVQCL